MNKSAARSNTSMTSNSRTLDTGLLAQRESYQYGLNLAKNNQIPTNAFMSNYKCACCKSSKRSNPIQRFDAPSGETDIEKLRANLRSEIKKERLKKKDMNLTDHPKL